MAGIAGRDELVAARAPRRTRLPRSRPRPRPGGRLAGRAAGRRSPAPGRGGPRPRASGRGRARRRRAARAAAPDQRNRRRPLRRSSSAGPVKFPSSGCARSRPGRRGPRHPGRPSTRHDAPQHHGPCGSAGRPAPPGTRFALAPPTGYARSGSRSRSTRPRLPGIGGRDRVAAPAAEQPAEHRRAAQRGAHSHEIAPSGPISAPRSPSAISAYSRRTCGRTIRSWTLLSGQRQPKRRGLVSPASLLPGQTRDLARGADSGVTQIAGEASHRGPDRCRAPGPARMGAPPRACSGRARPASP